MCLTAKDSRSEDSLSRALLELASSALDTRQPIVCNCISVELYMPTFAKIVEDYLDSTYELCEDG